jgi:lipopolysaccharide/colanic/teichoic acid biosynthesis glycosyltransferase
VQARSIGPAIVVDILCIFLALSLATLLRSWPPLDGFWQAVGWDVGRFASWGPRQTALFLYQAAVVPLGLYALGQYSLVKGASPNWSFPRLLTTVGASFALAIGVLYTVRVEDVPRSILLLDFVFLVVLLSLWREGVAESITRRLRDGRGLRNVLIVGIGPLARQVATEIVRNPLHARRVVGFVTDQERPIMQFAPDLHAMKDVWIPAGTDPVLLHAAVQNALHNPRHLLAPVAATEGLGRALDALNVEEVFIAPDVPRSVVQALLAAAQERQADVHLIPEHHAELGIQPEPWTLGPFTLLDVHHSPISRLGRAAKRSMDLVIGITGFILTLPLLTACAIAIKMEDPRVPVFYRGRRVGIKGRHFRQWKLSTMVRDADRYREELAAMNAREGPWFKIDEKDDPRISRVGRILRKYSLNDLPQFINVIKGDMSIVGPRPLAPDEVAKFIEFDARYHRIFDVKPGITGMWQIGDRNDPSFEYRVSKDFEYLQDWTIWKDLRIIARTPLAMLRPEK